MMSALIHIHTCSHVVHEINNMVLIWYRQLHIQHNTKQTNFYVKESYQSIMDGCGGISILYCPSTSYYYSERDGIFKRLNKDLVLSNEIHFDLWKLVPSFKLFLCPLSKCGKGGGRGSHLRFTTVKTKREKSWHFFYSFVMFIFI